MDINKIEVVVGTYEQFLLGYNLTESTKKVIYSRLYFEIIIY